MLKALSKIDELAEPIYLEFFPSSLGTVVRRLFTPSRRPNPELHLPVLEVISAEARRLIEEAGKWHKELQESDLPQDVKNFGNLTYFHLYYQASAAMLLRAYVAGVIAREPDLTKYSSVMRDFRAKAEERRQVIANALQAASQSF